MGESSRSLYERAKEHVADKKNLAEDSHMIKQWALDHSDLKTPPKFRFEIIGSFRDAVTRQVTEAVRIEHRGQI